MQRKFRISLVVAGGTAFVGALAYWALVHSLAVPRPHLAAAAGRRLIARPPRRVLVVTAHPDDLEIFIGGTLALLTQAGSEVAVVDLTNGEKGTLRRNLAPRRQREQLAAASVLGYAKTEFLHLPDLHLAGNHFLADALLPFWQDFRPELALAFDPTRPHPLIRHPDHIAGGRAVAELAARSSPAVPVWYYASAHPNVVVDIAPVIDVKTEALLCHRSQLRFGPGPYPPFVRMLGRLQGRSCGLAYGEGLRTDGSAFRA